MSTIKFGSFTVTSHVFYKSALSYGLVNLKPLRPGHVLVVPLRLVTRFADMTDEETVDFFLTVKKLSKVVEQYYKADALNIAIQDGVFAGQSVPHVHCHIIPRHANDFPDIDEVYKKLAGEEGDLEKSFSEVKNEVLKQRKTLSPDAEHRAPRTPAEMQDEAELLRAFIEAKSNL